MIKDLLFQEKVKAFFDSEDGKTLIQGISGLLEDQNNLISDRMYSINTLSECQDAIIDINRYKGVSIGIQSVIDYINTCGNIK